MLDPAPSEIHSPENLPDISAAVDQLEWSLNANEEIVVYSDRDIDGICGAAILLRLLNKLGAKVHSYVPGKWDGYGLNLEAINEIAADSTDLIVTVDCGTTALEEIERAGSVGIDVLVTDHHQPEDRLPDAIAIVNPRREDSEYPHEELAGGAVAFKVGQAFVETHAPLLIEDYHQYALPFATLATLGDYVALNLENRAIVREGFDRLFESGLPGLIETARHCDVESIRDLAWSLVPLLNAAQEDESGAVMLEHLLATEPAEISAGIEAMEEYREQRRQQREDRLAHLRECVERQANPEADDLLFVETDRYVGGVAIARLSEDWGRPVVAYRETDGVYRGGGRADPDIDFLELFEANDELLKDHWGHPGAAGFRVAPENLEAFKRRTIETLRSRYDPADLRPTLEIDARLEPATLDETLVRELERLSPFGPGNEEPIFLLENLSVDGYRTFGTDDRHCKLLPTDTDSFCLVYWDGTAEITGVDHPTDYDIAGTLGIDGFEDKLSMMVTDLRFGSAVDSDR